MSDPLDEREDGEREVKTRRVREDIDAENDRIALAAMLEDERFRDYLWRVISRCGPLNEAWDANYGKVSYNCGRQSVGRQLIADINLAAPQAWLAMQLKAAEGARAEHQAVVTKRLRSER